MDNTEIVTETKNGEIFLRDFSKPSVVEIVACFNQAHGIIRRKDNLQPTKAFFEMVKLLFVKLRQDQQIRQKLRAGESLEESDSFFTQSWIAKQSNASSDYVSGTLFRQVQQDLEAQIAAGTKKRIFASGEKIDLSADTILEVVGLLENYDLNEVGEDLNGRMFETFLTATIRGRELGQYFTPRSVVEYMVGVSENLKTADGGLPLVLDGCCGSGGFLIKAMDWLSAQIEQQSNLTNKEREAKNEKLKGECLWGIEANSDVARIARLNMYLHGDGGSRIYVADALDKDMRTTFGAGQETVAHLKEMREAVVDQNLRFDVVLTNPPFSMKYGEDKAERKILKAYKTVGGATAKSNTMFLERYTDLLRPGGEMLTVIDDTVLNGTQGDNQEIRKFIREHYIVKQVLSLPFNAFVAAEAGVKTSVLHLRRKTSEDEEQSDVFMAIAGNIGHSDSKKPTPELNSIKWVKQQYIAWSSTGRLSRKKPKQIPEIVLGNLGCQAQAFIVPAKKLDYDRLDAFYYSNELSKLKKQLRKKEKSGVLSFKKGSSLDVVGAMTKEDKAGLGSDALFYVDVGSVGQDGLSAHPQTLLASELPDRAKLQIKEGDVLFARNISSRGTTLLVPGWLDGGIASNGFIAIRPETEEEGLILWSLFRSEIWRTQIYYLATTAVQPEIKDKTFLEDMAIPWPDDPKLSRKILRTAQKMVDAYKLLHKAGTANKATIQTYTL